MGAAPSMRPACCAALRCGCSAAHHEPGVGAAMDVREGAGREALQVVAAGHMRSLTQL